MSHRLPELPKSFAFTLFLLGFSAQVKSQDWEWVITPYLWASDTAVDMSFNDNTIEGGIDFDDLIDKVDLGGQVHMEGSKGRAGFFLDLTYLSIKESESQAPTLPVDGKVRLETELETALVEIAGTYRVLGDSQLEGVDLFIGARVIESDVDVDVSFPGPMGNALSASVSETLVDGFAGARLITSFADHWTLALRGDVGTGDSDLTWNAQAMLMYRFGQNQRYGAILGYRYMQMEYESSTGGQDIDLKLTMSGPQLGFAMRF